jgi:hypothetical protein
MNSKVKVIIGLVIALVVLTVPFWYALGQRVTGRSDPPPEWKLPDDKKCVAPDMRAHHMELLAQWRDEVVREGIIDAYESEYSGESHERSLTRTCLKCHGDGKPAGAPVEAAGVATPQPRFCNQCHEYANVRPNCWDCHIEEYRDEEE